jgi:hypothetical protein
MPRSRSRSLESMTRSGTRWCAAKVPDCLRSSWSTSVVLPWSTWAMIAMLRMAAKSNNLDTIKPAFGAAAGTCKACHDKYKAD